MAEAIIDRANVTTMLSEDRVLTASEMTQMLRYLHRHSEDLENKIRQLKSELGRVARR